MHDDGERPGISRALACFGLHCVAAALIAAAIAAAGPARAQELHLTWNDCRTGPAAAAEASFDCQSNDGGHDLVAGFRLAQPVDSVIGLEAVIDLQHAAATLPEWWHLETGGCRSGGISAHVNFAGLSGCANPWGTSGVALIQIYQPGAPRGGASQVRVVAAVTVSPSDSARSLQGAVDYAALILRLNHALSTGFGACAGCGGSACLVLNSIELVRLPGGSGNVFLETPGPSDGNHATWQGSTANCTAVPVHTMPWGRLKSLYR